MRIKRALTAGAAAVVVLTATAGCEDGADKAAPNPKGPVTVASSAPPSPPSGTTEQGFGGALPEAADTATLARYVDLFTSCKEVVPGESYDATDDGSDAAWGAEEAADPSWGIAERAVCRDFTYPIALLTVADMAKFQTAAKASGDRFAIGENIAVVPVGDEQIQALSHSELVFLTCEDDFAPPSGYRTEKALVDGCVLSDYWPS
ncbi:hypothetical protein [Streptomyces sp. enrichment culture]|uniref:hypothetical protein n=1 Tax=Streptomyces sp. enrichment culture TaxID=1795815 RepID=UPI003F573083